MSDTDDTTNNQEVIDRELAEIDEVLAKHRKPPKYATVDAPAGSHAYWQKWREANKQKTKLYNKRSYLKRRKLDIAVELAAGKAALGTNVELDVNRALAETEEQITAAVDARRQMVERGLINPQQVPPLCVEWAGTYKIPVAVAFDIYKVVNSETQFALKAGEWRGENHDYVPSEEMGDSFAAEMEKRLKDTIGEDFFEQLARTEREIKGDS